MRVLQRVPYSWNCLKVSVRVANLPSESPTSGHLPKRHSVFRSIPPKIFLDISSNLYIFAVLSKLRLAKSKASIGNLKLETLRLLRSFVVCTSLWIMITLEF